MYIGQIRLELLDFLFFSSLEYGNYYKTSLYLHNYALCYALGLCPQRYFIQIDKTHYKEDLKNLAKQGIYTYPAKWVGDFTEFQFNSMRDDYLLSREQNSPYPIHGFIKTIAPMSFTITYIVAPEKLNLPSRIRLGKWETLTNVEVEWFKAEKVSKKDFLYQGVLNYFDLVHKPTAFNITELSLPNRLIENCFFENTILITADKIELPLCSFENI
ncbi:type I-D CRISPR-associated protein Cas5/Csc1 [Caldicellulosiruptor acetigenus]|uniref:CRISPR-associated protein Csc1 n=1 Tax=Caldicellulosiruptor acetigenus 6A TaxID=632516 RepID=G2PT70_9FIRM|nr:type I-D CRISPR-associated protein Cas5/Csc1 [Caldicellulosiruptor acetigenus]AEM74229.1 CRISPR-associated protein Csc1 [Caldicellulosiruptor acetigenus 6A]